MRKFEQKEKFIRNFLLGSILLVAVIIIIQKVSINIEVEKIKVFVNSFGVFAPLVYILLYTSTIIFSPLMGLPFSFTGLIMFGLWRTIVYIGIGNLLGASVNFFIGRKFGRPLIRKFMGDKGIDKIDEFTNIVGWQAFLVLRIFMGSFFDYVSYAMGLTSMKFRVYFLITLFGSLPMTILSLYIFHGTLNVYGNVYGILIFLGIAYALSLFSLLLFYFIKKTPNYKKSLTKV